MKIKSLAVASSLALAFSPLAGCTQTDLQVASAGVNAACAAAVIGTTVYVNVESSLGGPTAQKVATLTNQNTGTVCNSLTSSVQAMVQAITAAGGTATVTVTTQAPASAIRKTVAKLRISRRSITYIVKPNTSVLPFLGFL